MTGKTHITAGILTGITISAFNHFGFEKTVTYCVISGAAALIPDIDLVTSKAGAKIKPISFIINKFFGHRTICHAPIVYASIFFLLMSFFPSYSFYIDMIYFGIFSHLLLDMLNLKGIPLFYPFSRKRYNLASIKTNGFFEVVFNSILICCIAFIGYCMLNSIDITSVLTKSQ